MMPHDSPSMYEALPGPIRATLDVTSRVSRLVCGEGHTVCTRPQSSQRQKGLDRKAPSTHDPEPSSAGSAYCNAAIQCGGREEPVVPRHLLCSNAGGRLAVSGDGRVSEPSAVAWHFVRDLQRHRLRADDRHAVAVTGNSWAAVLQLLETAAAGDRSLSHAYSQELTISATAHLALSFLTLFRRRSESGGDQQDERKFCPP